MAANPLILDYKRQQLQRLPVPPDAAPMLAAPMPSQTPYLPTPSAPVVSQVDPAVQATRTRLLGDQAEYQRKLDSGSGISQIKSPILRTLARIGDTAERIILPGAEAFTPGTEGNHQRLLYQDQARLGQDIGQEREQAQTALLDVQPELKKQALENQLLRTQGTIQHQSDMLDLGQQKAQMQYAANLRAHGNTIDEADPTGKAIRPLRYEEMSEQQQAIADLKHAQQEQAEANAALKKAQNDPTSPAFKLAKQRVDNAARTASIAAGKLGLAQQQQEFQQDKFYNPQPTATQRTKGDLAQSALERVQEMRAVVNKHPEWFGPVAGRASNAEAAIGNNDPDMQTYLSAAQYLSDHSAGVFGGRGKYITQQLHSLTDPHLNPGALNAALDEAERSAQGFVKAGSIHGKGETSSYSGDSGHPKVGDVVDGYRFKGGNPSDQKNWEKQ